MATPLHPLDNLRRGVGSAGKGVTALGCGRQPALCYVRAVLRKPFDVLMFAELVRKLAEAAQSLTADSLEPSSPVGAQG